MCNNIVETTVPCNYRYFPDTDQSLPCSDKMVTVKCGSTGVDGEGIYCQTCLDRNGGRPWYICKHGNDVSEYMCGACEFE